MKNIFKAIFGKIKSLSIKRLYEGLKSFGSSFGFSFIVSWKASKKLLSFRVFNEILSALQPLATVYLGKDIIDVFAAFIQGRQSNPDYYFKKLSVLILLTLLVQVLGTVLQKINEMCTAIHRDIISNYINLQLVKKSSTLDISYFDSPKFYDELVNARRDSEALQSLAWFTVNLIRSGVQFISAAVVLLTLNWLFPVILILLNLPTMLVERKFTRYIYGWGRSWAPEERKMSYFQNLATNKSFAKDVRLFGLLDEILSRYTVIWKKWFGEKKALTIKRGRWATLLSIVPAIGSAGVNFYIGVQILYSNMSLGSYSLYGGMGGQLISSIGMLISTITSIYENDIRISNYKKFLAWEPAFTSSGTLKPSGIPTIEFKHVSFKYPFTDKYVLEDVNFRINSGEKVALVGLNGSGKSTIIKLILGFYPPDEGEILIDGKNLHDYDLKELRNIFAVLFQDYANYSLSVRESISISSLDRRDDEAGIMEASALSGADQFIGKWEKGYDTFLSKQFDEAGEELSGGQWQKVALARTFFRKAAIIVLDEPSSALDPEAEHQVFTQFAQLCRDKGAIFISHRLSNVTMADRVLVLEDKSIIENGSHEELMRLDGRYSYLFNLQASKYNVGNPQEALVG